MNRTELLAKIQPLADKLAKDITAVLGNAYDGHRDRALQLAREALQLELDQEDVHAEKVEARPTRKRAPRRAADRVRVPAKRRNRRMPSAAKLDAPGVAPREPDRARADVVAEAPAAAKPGRAPKTCTICGEIGHTKASPRHKAEEAPTPDPADRLRSVVAEKTAPAPSPIQAPPLSAGPIGSGESKPLPAHEKPETSDDDEEGPDVELLVTGHPRRRVRNRPRRTRVRSKTIAVKRITREDLRIGAIMYPPVDIERPRTRGDCAGDDRPCPYVACRHHLYLEVNAETGSIKINFPDLEPWELAETCSLDVADRGGVTLEEVGAISNLTRERVRQIEVRGLLRIKYDHAIKLSGDEPAPEAA